MTSISRRTLLMGVALLGVAAAPAVAQEFPDPDRSITIVVPVPPGGGTDGVARLIAPKMAEDLGVRVDIVNRAGASMQIGTHEVATAEPDGYTLLVGVLPTLMAWMDPDRESTYDRDDLQPIASAVEEAPAVTVLADSPYETLDELVEAARANPGQLTAGTPGLMATGHLASVGFAQAVDADFATVNFTGGAALLTALLGGHVDIAFNSITEVIQQQEAGEVRILGVVSGDEEHSSGVPTVIAQGYDMPVLSVNIGVLGPAGIPEDVLEILSASVERALNDPEVTAALEEQSRSIMYLDSSAYAEYMDEVETNFGPLIDIAKEHAE